MTLRDKFILAGLLIATAIVLTQNASYLFVAPVPNAWVWWGDETWLMSQYREFLTTGHYINPLAPGSMYAQCSGIIFGSCYLTAALYGIPALLVAGHTLAIGRLVSWSFGIIAVISVWVIARNFRVNTLLAACGVFLLSSSFSFFMASHSARSDMLIGTVELLLIATVVRLLNSSHSRRSLWLALLIPSTLLINGHLFILNVFMFVYAFYRVGIFYSLRISLNSFLIIATGFIALLSLQFLLLNSFSITGPFLSSPDIMPLTRILHWKADLTNAYWRIQIMEMWAPGCLIFFVLVISAVLWTKVVRRSERMILKKSESDFIILATLAIASSVLIEHYELRYFIFILPTTIVLFLILLSNALERGMKRFSVVCSIGLSLGLCWTLWNFETEDISKAKIAASITEQNSRAVSEALNCIHSYSRHPRIFSSVPAQAIAMDDSCVLFSPVLFDFPTGTSTSRSELMKIASPDYAILFYTGNANVGAQMDSVVDFSPGSRMIFQRTGALTDVDCSYDASDLMRQDTLRVYQFLNISQKASSIAR